MRKIFIFIISLVALTAAAQTAQSPIELREGEQTISGLSSWSSVYMTYTAPSDQFVTITGISSSLDITSDGKTVSSYYGSAEKENCFLIPSGATYTISFYYMDSATEMAINVKAKEQPYTTGETCQTAIEAGEEPFFVPFYKPSGWGSAAVPIFIKYTPKIDGKLTMHFTSSVSGFKYAEGCSGEYTPLEGLYASGGYDYTMQVEAETEYIFQGSSSGGMMATFVTKVPVLGASCDDAAVLKRGNNVLPAEVGSYWYTFTTPTALDSYFVTLTTNADLTGGSATISSSCSSTYGQIIQNGGLHQRIKLNKGTSRVLEIKKQTALVAPGVITLDFTMVEDYDSFDTAPEIETGIDQITPDFGGEYYYAVTAPTKGNYFLKVASNLASVPAGTKVEIFNEKKSYSAEVTGTASAQFNVVPGEKYIIKWTCPTDLCSMPFTVEFTEVKKGETASDPIVAVIGDNEIPAYPDVFYVYTAEANSWIIATPADENLNISIKSVETIGSTASIVTTYTENGSYRFEGITGKIYLIEVKGATSVSSFNLSTRDYAPGENQANPIIAGSDPVVLPDVAGTTWIRYTAAEDGIVDVATDVTYAYSNIIRVYLGDVSANESKALAPDGNSYKALSYVLQKGDVLNVSATISPAQTGKVITFTSREPKPGEFPSSAIHIDFSENPMTYTFDKIVGYSDDPVWYSINLTKDIFNLDSEKAFTMNLYVSDNTENPIATSSGSYYGPNKIENAMVTEPGLYYIKLVSSSAPFTATLSERNAQLGETPATAIKIITTSNPYTETFAASDYARWYSVTLQQGELNIEPNASVAVELFSSDNFTTAMAKATIDWSTWNYAIKDCPIPVAGVYYIKMPASSSAIDTKLSGTAIIVNQESGVGMIEAEEETLYYNLEGLQVSNPRNGIYIRLRGKKVDRIIIK